MTNFIKKQHILTIALAAFFIILSVHGVDAQGGSSKSISGDEVCGSSSSASCTLADAQAVFGGVLKLIIYLGGSILVVFIIIRILLAYKSLIEGNSQAFKVAGQQAFNAVLGFLIIVAVASSILLVGLKLLGAQDWTLSLAKLLSSSSQTVAPKPVK